MGKGGCDNRCEEIPCGIQGKLKKKKKKKKTKKQKTNGCSLCILFINYS